MTTARLGISVDSSEAKGAAVDLDALVKASQRSEKAEGSRARANKQAETATRSLAAAVKQLTAAEQSTSSGSHAKRAQDVAAYGAELDRLRAKFNPVFAASKAYESSLEELNMAHRVGAVSATEYDAALIDLNNRFQMITASSAAAGAGVLRMGRSTGQINADMRNLQFQLVDIGQALATAPTMGIYALQNLGFQVAQIGQLYMGNGGFNQAIKDSAVQIASFVRYAGPAVAVVGALAAGIATMRGEINRTSDVSVSFGDVVVGSIQAAADAINDLLAPAIQAIAPWFQEAWDLVITATKLAGNLIINSNRIAIEAIATGVRSIPDVFAAAWGKAKEHALDAIASIAGAVDRVIFATVTGFNEAFGLDLKVPDATSKAYGSLLEAATDAGIAGSEAADRAAAAWEGFGARVGKIAEDDPMGRAFDAVSARAQARALARSEEGVVSGRGRGSSNNEIDKAARELERLDKAYKQIISNGQQFIAQQEMEGRAVGLTAEAANRMRYEFEFLNEAQRAGIDLTTEQTKRLMALASQKADAEARTRSLTEAHEEAAAAQENLARGLAAVSDRFTNAVQQADNFGDALKRMGIELLNMSVQGLAGQGPLGPLLGSLLTGAAGVAGASYSPVSAGGFGSLSSGIYAKGGAFSNGAEITPFARGGIVSGPTMFPMSRGMGLMGEAGPEAVMPLSLGPNGKLGVEASGSSPNVFVNVTNNVGAEVSVEQRETHQGPTLEIMIDKAVARQISRGGSNTRRSMANVNRTVAR